MGTVAAVQWRGAADGAAAVARVKAVFSRVERLLNAHDPGSELSRLAGKTEREILDGCDPYVRPCYETAFRLMHETDGAFNPAWKGKGTLDLGAIAKGFAVDLAAAELDGDFLIDLGGNLKAVSAGWKVGVYDPATGGTAGVIELGAGEACATSATYARGLHIVDGRSGAPVERTGGSVTVVHPSSAMLADGLSTISFILGPDRAAAFMKQRYGSARLHWR